ncbi:immunoglobulin lambda-1 light chain-like isoform X2 [Sphaerodactylus townsendi]|uniref:immunoglobulin lambda-1 light chain-like isoform X2 n=1 Tax=Sphaerodactylus townsendi TaxID=933632 RepID=UPI0020260B57|nr:immunoglobulin lambda-1 light chain-like isoform X2 [Sphaerodactylus townsendi]
MTKSLMLFLFLAFFGGCDAQFTMTQPPSVSAAIGETVKISCRRSSESIDDYWNSWYQQKPSSAPKLLIYRNDDRESGISDRFSGSLDSSANAAILTISSVQIDDEADYYCLSYDSSLQYVFGGGTQLTVLSQAKAAPAVFVYPPSSEEVAAQNKVTLVCLMNNFYPGAVQVTWKADNAKVTEGVETTRPSKQSDNRYLASSYLFLSATDWASHNNYTCQVTHEGVDYEASVDRLECP